MKLIKIPDVLFATLSAISIFLLCFAVASLIEPYTFQKFFSAESIQAIANMQDVTNKDSYYWDVHYYANMAIKDQCIAFYPMLPWLVRNLFRPQTFEQAVVGLKIVSCVCFLIGIPFFFDLVKKISNSNSSAFLLTLLYTVSPMAIYRVIGYTEGLFSLLSLILIWLITNTELNKRYVYIYTLFVISIMSLTRPIALQITFSASISLIAIVLFNQLKNGFKFKESLKNIKHKHQSFIYLSLIMIVGSAIAYSIYGFICVQLRGDFFAPFADQKLWDKSLGFYPQIFLPFRFPFFEQMALYFPTIFLIVIIVCLYSFVKCKQIEIFLPKLSIWWCLLAIYPPILVVVYIFVFLQQKFKINNLSKIDFSNSLKLRQISTSYPFWFCFNFVLSHVIINLITTDKIPSLARYNFGLPFFFIALAYVLKDIKNTKIDRLLAWFILVGLIALVEQWVRYGKNLWLG